jgi:hypothetical protein
MSFQISQHALEEMKRRELPKALVESILKDPQQIVDEYGNRKAFQSIINLGKGKDYLVRVIVNDTLEPAKVVTVYKTSRIMKYWREK